MDRVLLETLFNQMTKQEMARHLNCSVSQVHYWLTKHKLRKNLNHPYDEFGEKECPNCDVTKPLEDFYKRKDGIPGSWCKKCMNKQAVDRQRQYKKEAIDYKGGACSICQFDLYPGALEFHHLDSKAKDSGISRMAQSPFSSRVRAELDKCVLLCANCHRMAHAGLIVFNANGEILMSPYK